MELETRVETWAEDDLEEPLVYKILGVDWKKGGLEPSLEEFKQRNFKQNDTFKKKNKTKALTNNSSVINKRKI